MTFPRELRDVIPALHSAQDLELDSIDGRIWKLWFWGPLVRLKFVVKGTGKLNARFVIGMDLQPDAARKLAATLTKLADEAESARV